MKNSLKNALLFGLDVLVNAIVIIFLVVVIRFYIISPFQVHGPSMCDSFNNFEGHCIRSNGEYIMIYKLGYQNIFGWQIGTPKRGDVVVFKPPNYEKKGDYLIKRVIGLPGETIEIRNGYIYIFNTEKPEGFKLDESEYLNDLNWGHTEPQSNHTRFEIPEDGYFVLGDNRRASSDSRRCFEQTGCDEENKAYLSLEKIQGKAFVVFWPLEHMRWVKNPSFE